jgi:hypothetical protein
MREAKQSGRLVDEPVLAELTQGLAEAVWFTARPVGL